MKFLEENIEERLLDISLGNDFLDMTPKSQGTKAKIGKRGLHQTKKLLYSKVITRMKRKPTD